MKTKRYLQFKVYQDDLGNFIIEYGKIGRGEEALKDFIKELKE